VSACNGKRSRNVNLELRNVSLELRNVSLELRRRPTHTGCCGGGAPLPRHTRSPGRTGCSWRLRSGAFSNDRSNHSTHHNICTHCICTHLYTICTHCTDGSAPPRTHLPGRGCARGCRRTPRTCPGRRTCVTTPDNNQYTKHMWMIVDWVLFSGVHTYLALGQRESNTWTRPCEIFWRHLTPGLPL
jgi:hypothetical protein